MMTGRLKGRRYRAALALGILLGCLTIADAHAEGSYSFAQVKSRIESGQYDAARQLVAASGEDSPSKRVAKAFTEALILKHQRQLQASADAMEAILLDNPEFDRVRQELAHSYYLLGENDHARHQFGILSATSHSPAFRSLYNDYLDAIDSRRPWSLDGYVALAPSTNISRGVAADTVFIGGVAVKPANRKQSGIGVSFGGSGSYRFDLDERMGLTLGGSFDGTKYGGREYDSLSGQVFSEFSYKTGRWRFGVGPTMERLSFDWQGYRLAYGAQWSIQKSFGNSGDTMRFTGRLRRLDYDDLDAFDGYEISGGLRYQHAFSAALVANAGAELTRVKAEREFNSYNAVRPYFEIYSDLPFGVLGSIGLGYQFRDYDGKFPWTGENRRDGQLSLVSSLTFRGLSFRRIAPRLEYAYVRNNSNIGLYDYDTHSMGVYLTRKY